HRRAPLPLPTRRSSDLDKRDLVAVDFHVRKLNGALAHGMVVARLARERIAGFRELIDILLDADRRIEFGSPLADKLSGTGRQGCRNEQGKNSEETRSHEASVSKFLLEF